MLVIIMYTSNEKDPIFNKFKTQKKETFKYLISSKHKK